MESLNDDVIQLLLGYLDAASIGRFSATCQFAQRASRLEQQYQARVRGLLRRYGLHYDVLPDSIQLGGSWRMTWLLVARYGLHLGHFREFVATDDCRGGLASITTSRHCPGALLLSIFRRPHGALPCGLGNTLLLLPTPVPLHPGGPPQLVAVTFDFSPLRWYSVSPLHPTSAPAEWEREMVPPQHWSHCLQYWQFDALEPERVSGMRTMLATAEVLAAHRREGAFLVPYPEHVARKARLGTLLESDPTILPDCFVLERLPPWEPAPAAVARLQEVGSSSIGIEALVPALLTTAGVWKGRYSAHGDEYLLATVESMEPVEGSAPTAAAPAAAPADAAADGDDDEVEVEVDEQAGFFEFVMDVIPRSMADHMRYAVIDSEEKAALAARGEEAAADFRHHMFGALMYECEDTQLKRNMRAAAEERHASATAAAAASAATGSGESLYQQLLRRSTFGVCSRPHASSFWRHADAAAMLPPAMPAGPHFLLRKIIGDRNVPSGQCTAVVPLQQIALVLPATLPAAIQQQLQEQRYAPVAGFRGLGQINSTPSRWQPQWVPATILLLKPLPLAVSGPSAAFAADAADAAPPFSLAMLWHAAPDMPAHMTLLQRAVLPQSD